jgi:hypothetical protein
MESKNTKSNYLDKLKPLVFAKDVTPPKTLRDVIVNIYVNKNNTFRIDKTGKYRVVEILINIQDVQLKMYI